MTLVERRPFPVRKNNGTGHGATPHRFPVGPLLERMEATPVLSDDGDPTATSPAGLLAFRLTALFAGSLDTTRSRVHRWIRKGGLTMNEADVVAVALGHHPSVIWSNWWDDVEGDDL